METYREQQQESYKHVYSLNEEERQWMKMIGVQLKQPYVKQLQTSIDPPKGLQEQYRRNPRTHIEWLKHQMDFLDIRLSGLENAIIELRLQDQANGTHTKPNQAIWKAHEAYRNRYIDHQMEYTRLMKMYGFKIKEGDKYAFTGKP